MLSSSNKVQDVKRFELNFRWHKEKFFTSHFWFIYGIKVQNGSKAKHKESIRHI
jgi:hypothetical protein